MVSTADLINELCATLKPVRRLRPPLLRAGLWLLIAAAIIVLLAALHGVRPGLTLLMQTPAYLAALAGSLLTGTLAAIAAFELSLPDRSRAWLLLPTPALALWAATIGYGCLTDWVRLEPGGVRLGSTMECLATLLLISVPCTAGLFSMLRHSARLHPTTVALTGGLATAGMASTGLSLLHAIDATVMVLLWHLGAAILIVALSGMLGRKLLASARVA